MTLILILVCSACRTINGFPILKVAAKSSKEALPSKVAHLLTYWPDKNVLLSDKRMKGDENKYVRSAKNGSILWIGKVLSPEWLPTEKEYLKNNLIMIRNEFGEFDVTRVEWTKKSFQVQVSQMAGIIAVKLTPLDQRNTGETVEQKIAFAKNLCGQIVNNNGMRRASRHSVDDKGKVVKKNVKVAVHDLSAKIRDYSFRTGLVRQFPDGIIGIAATKEDEGIRHGPRDSNDVDRENREDNPKWDKSPSSWGYWWRHVSWWHDGNSIAFFTLQTESGAWAANYWDNMGDSWFEGRVFKLPKR